jgi:hypothetical protein
MAGKLIIPVILALLCGWQLAAAAQKKPAKAASAISAQKLSREQFVALPQNAVIDFGSERITKSEFLARRNRELEQAVKAMNEAKAHRQTEFEARRKALLDRESAKLADANKKVEAEVTRLSTADAAAHGPNWEARRKQAADLLAKADKATPEERSALVKQAADLLAPATK